MLLVILWCFILANVKLADSLNYDSQKYRVYPRLDFTCSNSTFNFEFNINNNNNNINYQTQQPPRVLVYQDQNGKMKYFLVKLVTTIKSSQQRLVFSDHWNQNVEIAIDLSSNQWYKFIYRRKTPIGTAEMLLQQMNNDVFVNIYQKDLTADLSKFGVSVYDFSNLFVGGLPTLTNDKVLTVRDIKSYSKFNGQMRNFYYSSIDTALQQSQKPSAVSSTCACEQLPRRQYAIFNNNLDSDACENDYNKNLLCSKDCNCLTTSSDHKCECSEKTSSNCESSIDKTLKSYQINFNDDKFSSNEIIYSLLSSLSSLMSVKLSDVKWNANNGLEFRTANSFVSFKQSSNIKDVDSCFWNIDKCSNGFTQFIELKINRLESTKLNEKVLLFQNGQADKQSTLICYLYKSRIYFSLFDSTNNKEWLVSAQIGDYLKQNINEFSISLTWDNAKPSFTLHINGIVADYVINPLNKQINGDILIQSQNYIYQFGLISEKIKPQQQQQNTHQYQIRSVRRDYYENGGKLSVKNESSRVFVSTVVPTKAQNTKLIPLILLSSHHHHRHSNNNKARISSSNNVSFDNSKTSNHSLFEYEPSTSDYYFNEEDYDESSTSTGDDYDTLYSKNSITETSNKQPLWINTDNSVPAILRSIFKMPSYYERPVRVCYTKAWPTCVRFLLDSSKPEQEIRLNSIAYKFTKYTPALIANNPDMPEFDVTKLENSINGFYLSTYIKLLVSKAANGALMSKTKIHVLTTPNIILTWQSITNTTEDGHLDIIIKFSDSYYYKSLLIPFKLNKYYFIEINFDPLNATLDVYKNTILYSTTNIHSFYDPELFTFSDSLFEIGPIIDERHTVVLDGFKLYNTAKSYFKSFKKSLQNKNVMVPLEHDKQFVNLRGDLKTVLKVNTVSEKNKTLNSYDQYKSNEYEYEYQDNNSNSSGSEYSFYFDEMKFNDTFDSQDIDEADELFQFDGISRPSSISYSNNARFVSDEEIPNERKVLFLDGKKNFAKVSFNNFLQDPARLTAGFTLIAHFKTSRLNVDNMYFMSGNGLEMFTLNKEMIVKYQTDDKEWTSKIPNLKENKWYTLNITWDIEQGLKIYVDNTLANTDRIPSSIDSIDYLTTDLLIGQPPANIVANYGEFLMDYLVILPTSKLQTNTDTKSYQPLDARVIESAPYPDIIRIDNNVNRVVYKIDSPLTTVTSESIELCFQTTEANGVVFYIHNNPVISYFEIMNGQPIFVIETQYQVIQLRPYINYRLDDSAWHTIKFQRNGQRVILQLDKSVDESTMSHSGAILTGSSVYLGLADPNNVRLSIKKPFVGHMSRAKVVINNVQQNVRQQPYIKYDTSVSSVQANPTNINIDTSQLSNLDGKTINIILNFYGPPGSKPGNTNVIQTDVETHIIYLDTLPDTRYISVSSQDREVEFFTGSVVLDIFSIKFQTRKSNGQLCVLHIDDQTYIGLEVFEGLPYATYSYSNRKERVKLSNKRVDDGKIYQAFIKQDPNQVTCWFEHDDTYKTPLIYGSGLNINAVRVGGDGNRYDFKSGNFVGCIGSIILNQRDVIDYKFVQSERRQKCENVINTPIYATTTLLPVVTATQAPTIDISFGYVSFLEPDDLYYFNYVYDSEKPTFNDISFIFQTVASDGILFSAYELVNNHINNLIGAYLQSGRVHVVFANITTTIDIPFNDLSNVNNGYIHRLYVRRHMTGEIQAFLQSYTISQTIEFSTQPITIRISRLIVGGTDEAPRIKIFGTLPNFIGCILDSFQLNGLNLFIPTQIPKLRYECPVKPTETLVTHLPITRPTIRETTTPVIPTQAPSSCYSSCNSNDCLIELRDGYFIYQVQNLYSRERDYIKFTFRISTSGVYNLLTIPYPDRSITIYVSNGRLMVNTIYRNVLDTYPVGTEKYDDGRWHQVNLEKQYQELIVNVDGFSQYVNIGIDFDLYGDGRLYFGASNTHDRHYLVGELRAIYSKFGNEEYDILASVKDSRIPGAFCHGTVIVRPYIVEVPAKPGFKCAASPAFHSETDCHTDGACYAALWRNASGEIERHMRCFNKDQLQPKENPLLCRYQEDVRFVIKCCYSDYCNRDLDLKLIDISKNNERSIWRFKGPNPGSLQYFTQSTGLIESQLIFEFNTTQLEGPLLLTRDDNQLLKLELKGSKIQLSLSDMNNRRPTKIIECTASRPLLFNDNKWHKVQLVKKNKIITLTCDDGTLQQLQSDTEIPFVNTKYGVKLGSQSLDPKAKSYIGDISQIIYSENNVPYTFDDLQYSEDKRYTYDGYVEFIPKFILQAAADPKPIKFRSSTSSAKLLKWDKEKSSGISFEFKTSNANQNGLILSTQKNGQYFAVVLVDGYIEVVLSPHTLLAIDKSNPSIDRYQRMFPFPHSKVNDGRWHKFQLSVDSFSVGSIVLDDNESSKFRIYKLDYWTEESDLVFGRNLDINSQINSDLDSSFIGCLKNVVIGNKIIDWSISGSLYNIEAGCYNDIYRDNYLPFFQTSLNNDNSASIATFGKCLKYSPPSRNSDKETVEFMFKTSDDKSALFNSIGSDVNIYTQGPAVVIKSTGITNKLLVERGIAFNDGNWHTIRIEKNEFDILVSIDEKYAQLVRQNRRIQLGPFYIGCLRGKSNGEARDLKGEVASLVYSSSDQTKIDLIDGLSSLNQYILVDDNLKWIPSKDVAPIESKYTPITLTDSSSYVYLEGADFEKTPNSRILFSFKTNENNGLLAFIGQNITSNDKSNFLAVELIEGIPNLVVNIANQLKRVECSIDKLNDNKWHEIEIRRDRLGDAGNNNGASSTITFRCDNRFNRFEALEEAVQGRLVIGNSDSAFSRLPSQLWLSRSPKYLGCIKDLVINDRHVDIYDQTSQNSRNTISIGCVESTSSCRLATKCQNSGSCVEGFSETYCNCDATSFTGKTCEKAAKTLLFNGSYGIEYYSENKLYSSSSEEIFVRFRTRLRHGVIVGLKKSNDNAGLVVAVEDGRVKVVYQCGRNDKVAYVGDINAYNTNKWNSIRLKRYGQKLIIEVIDGDKGQKTIVDDLGKNCAQFDYNTIVVGSIFSQRLLAEYPNFIGFIQNLHINNEEIFSDYVSSSSGDSSRNNKWSITGNAEVGESILLLHHQVSFKNTGCPITLAEVYTNEKFNLHLLFKTSQPSGVIFFRRGRDLFPYMILELVEGTLKFSFDLGTGLTVIKCDKIYNLNDKTWHRVSIKRIGSQFVMQVDNSNEIAADILPNSRPLIELESFIVGGIPSKYNYLLKDIIVNPIDYTGCLASFEINGEVPDLLHEARHICPSLQYGCLDLTCSPNPCYNNGQCSVETGQIGCDCEQTSYSGSFCQDDSKFFFFGGKQKQCGIIRYKLVPAALNTMNDRLAFGFYTSQTNAVLIRIESDKGDQYFEVRLLEGVPQIIAKFDNEPESKLYSLDRKFNDNHYHVIQITRERNKFLFKVDNFIQEELCLQRSDGIFRSQSIIYAGSIYDDANELSNCFYGYMSGMVFNRIRILDLGSSLGTDVVIAPKPADTSIVNITVNLVEDGSCPLGYKRNGKLCFFIGCPRVSEFLAQHMCRCLSGYIRVEDECHGVPDLPSGRVELIRPSTKLILAPAVGVAETPIGLILGILSGIGLAILGAAIAARKCADGACIPRRDYVRVPVHVTPSIAVAQVVTGTVSNATDTLIRRDVPIERRDMLTEEVINTHQEDIYHEKGAGAAAAVDVLDFGYIQAPIITQSVNETMEMYEQSTAHRDGGGAAYITTGVSHHGGGAAVHHHASQRDLAMDSLFYTQNATDYELSNVTCVTMTPNGKYAIIGQSPGSPQIWDTTNGQLIRSMNGVCSNCSNLMLACDGALLVGLASDANGALEGHALNLQLWEVQTGRPIQLTHQIKCCVFALSSDSNSIFMAGNQRFGRGISVGILDLVSNELVKEIKSDPNISFGDFPESVVITPDEKHAIVACKTISGGTNFVVFDLAKTTEIAQTRSIALDAEPKCIQVLNNNEVLTGTRGGHIVQWNIHSCKPTITFVDPNENRAHNANVNQILLSPDKEYLASGSSDGTAKVWNTSTKQLVSVMTGHQGEITCLAMSHNPNNDLLITGSADQSVCLWRLYTGHQVSSMSVGMNLVEVYMAKHNKTIVAIGEKDGEQQLLLLKVINVQK